MSFGGVQRVVQNMIKALFDRYEVSLILFEKKEIKCEIVDSKVYYLDELKFNYQEIVREDIDTILKKGEELFNFRVESLQRVLGDLDFDLFISHEEYNNLIFLEAMKDRRYKAIFYSHIDINFYRDKMIHLLNWDFYKNRVEKNYKNRKIISVSEGVQSSLKSVGVSSRVIDNGVDIDEVIRYSMMDIESFSGVERFRFLKKYSDFYKIDSDFNYILEVSRVEFAQKGQDDLLKAYAKIVHKIDEHLLFIGEGKDLDRLEEQVYKLGLEGRVHIVGFLKNPFPFMKRSSLMLFPSYYEGLPNVLLESLALNLPILSYNFLPSCEEISKNGRYFEVIERGDIDMLASSIEGILRDSKRAKRLRELAKERSEFYDISKSNRELRSILESL